MPHGGALKLLVQILLLQVAQAQTSVTKARPETKVAAKQQRQRRRAQAACTTASDCLSGICNCASSGRRLFGAPVASCSCAPASPPPPSPPPPSPAPAPPLFAFSSSQIINGQTVTCSSTQTTATYTQCTGLMAQGYDGFRNGVSCGPVWKITNPTGSDLIGFCQSLVGSSSSGHRFHFACTTSTTRSTWNAGVWGTATDNGKVDRVECHYPV